MTMHTVKNRRRHFTVHRLSASGKSRVRLYVFGEVHDWPVWDVVGDVDDVLNAVSSEAVDVKRVLRVADVQVRRNKRRRRRHD